MGLNLTLLVSQDSYVQRGGDNRTYEGRIQAYGKGVKCEFEEIQSLSTFYVCVFPTVYVSSLGVSIMISELVAGGRSTNEMR